MGARAISRHIGVFPYVIVHAVVDDALSPDFPLGDAVEVFVRREDTERFIEEVRVDESVLIVAPRDPLSHQLRHRRASSRRGVVPRPHGSRRLGG